MMFCFQFIAGKTADDNKKDSGGEGANEFVDPSNMAKQKIDVSKMLLPTSVSSSLTLWVKLYCFFFIVHMFCTLYEFSWHFSSSRISD